MVEVIYSLHSAANKGPTFKGVTYFEYKPYFLTE